MWKEGSNCTGQSAHKVEKEAQVKGRAPVSAVLRCAALRCAFKPLDAVVM